MNHGDTTRFTRISFCLHPLLFVIVACCGIPLKLPANSSPRDSLARVEHIYGVARKTRRKKKKREVSRYTHPIHVCHSAQGTELYTLMAQRCMLLTAFQEALFKGQSQALIEKVWHSPQTQRKALRNREQKELCWPHQGLECLWTLDGVVAVRLPPLQTNYFPPSSIWNEKQKQTAAKNRKDDH